jgi:hypothetical protein
MKNLILLCLVIGAAISTTTELTTNALGAWSITSSTPSGIGYYAYTLAYSVGTTAATAVHPGTTAEVGVICQITDSTFSVAAAGPGVSWSFKNTGPAATSNSATTAWAIMEMTYHPLMDATGVAGDGNLDTGAGSVACVPVTNPTPAPTLVTSDNSLTWVTTHAIGCGAFPQFGLGSYMQCYNIAAQAKVISTANDVTDVAVTYGNSVTITATSTTTTTGASTFATGATILAGLAYMQF